MGSNPREAGIAFVLANPLDLKREDWRKHGLKIVEESAVGDVTLSVL